MTESEILPQLVAILKDLSPSTQVLADQNDRTLESMGFDSLDVSGLLLKLEERYDISISEEEAENLQTLGDFAASIAAKKAG